MNLLVLCTFIPLVGAIALLLLPKGSEGLMRLVALATTLVVAALGIILFVGFDGNAGLQYGVETGWFTLRIAGAPIKFTSSWRTGSPKPRLDSCTEVGPVTSPSTSPAGTRIDPMAVRPKSENEREYPTRTRSASKSASRRIE